MQTRTPAPVDPSIAHARSTFSGRGFTSAIWVAASRGSDHAGKSFCSLSRSLHLRGATRPSCALVVGADGQVDLDEVRRGPCRAACEQRRGLEVRPLGRVDALGKGAGEDRHVGARFGDRERRRRGAVEDPSEGEVAARVRGLGLGVRERCAGGGKSLRVLLAEPP